MAELAFLNSHAFTKRTGGPPRSPRPRRGGGRVLSVGTLLVGVVACHLGAHGGGCNVPGYGTGRQAKDDVAGRRETCKAPQHHPLLALGWFPQPWYPVWRVQIGDSKGAAHVYCPPRWPGTPLTVQPSPTKTSPDGLFPSQRVPPCGNIKLPNYSTGINESSNTLP